MNIRETIAAANEGVCVCGMRELIYIKHHPIPEGCNYTAGCWLLQSSFIFHRITSDAKDQEKLSARLRALLHPMLTKEAKKNLLTTNLKKKEKTHLLILRLLTRLYFYVQLVVRASSPFHFQVNKMRTTTAISECARA
jgi:hypothetical protein